MKNQNFKKKKLIIFKIKKVFQHLLQNEQWSNGKNLKKKLNIKGEN